MYIMSTGAQWLFRMWHSCFPKLISTQSFLKIVVDAKTSKLPPALRLVVGVKGVLPIKCFAFRNPPLGQLILWVF